MSGRNERTRWEYKTVTCSTKGRWAKMEFNANSFDAMLNQLGQDGWELVSTTSLNEVQGRSIEIVAVFKRIEN